MDHDQLITIKGARAILGASANALSDEQVSQVVSNVELMVVITLEHAGTPGTTPRTSKT